MKQPRPKDRKASLTIQIGLPDREFAAAISKSLQPETIERAAVRSQTQIRTMGKEVEMRIDASDLVALRAAFNSFMRFLLAAMMTVETVSAFNKLGTLKAKR